MRAWCGSCPIRPVSAGRTGVSATARYGSIAAAAGALSLPVAIMAGGGDYGGGWQPGPGWDTRFTVGCASEDYRYRFCQVDLGGAGRAYVSRKISGAECIEGRTWGWNR